MTSSSRRDGALRWSPILRARRRSVTKETISLGSLWAEAHQPSQGRIGDDLLRYPATTQSAVQSAAMGGVQFPGRPALWGMARRAIDASDWRLRTRAGSLWSAIQSIWRSSPPPRFLVQHPDGGAAPTFGAATATAPRPAAAAPALATRS